MKKRRGLLFLLCTIGLILIGVFVMVGLNHLMEQRKKNLANSWAMTLESYDTFGKLYPKLEVNRSALALEKLTAQMGIDLTPKTVKRQGKLDKSKIKAFQED